jgi:Tfp pilus assembly protein PilN
MNEVMQWASFLRDIGLILGIPVLLAVGVKLYSQQIEILKARNELLKETQYDRAVSLLESQKKIFLLEREAMDKQIADLERLKNEKEAKVAELKHSIEEARSMLEDILRGRIPTKD